MDNVGGGRGGGGGIGPVFNALGVGVMTCRRLRMPIVVLVLPAVAGLQRGVAIAWLLGGSL